MSTWAAVAVKGAAVLGTGSAGAGITRVITPGALDGFAAGTLLTGMCFLVVFALRSLRRARLATRPRPDYYAAPADVHSAAGEPADLPEPAAQDPVQAADEATEPELQLAFAEPAPDLLAPAASGASADADPDVPEIFPTVPSPRAPSPYAPDPLAPGPFADDPGTPDPYAAAEAFGSSVYDDDMVPAGDDALHGGRGYRSKHRMMAAETMGRSPDTKRKPARHAAPSARLSTRKSSRLASIP